MIKMWSEVEECFNTGVLSHKHGMGKWVTKFEKAMVTITGFPYCCLYVGGTVELLWSMISKSPGISHIDIKTCLKFNYDSAWAVMVSTEKEWIQLKQLGAQGYDFNVDYGFDKIVGANFRPTELTAAALYHLYVTDKLEVDAYTAEDIYYWVHSEDEIVEEY